MVRLRHHRPDDDFTPDFEPQQPGDADDEIRSPTRRQRAREKTMAVLPSLFTIANALCGFFAIFLASRPVDAKLPFEWTPLTYSALFIFTGMVFDALDGRIARMTGQTSDLGEQLDSMSDMVTFGVAPAFLAVRLTVLNNTPFLSYQQDQYFDRAALIVAMIYVACTALRLARFNVELENPEEKDHMTFKGLPSPGAAGTIASLILLHQHFLARNNDPGTIGATSIGMVLILLLVAIAMVSSLRYSHVMNRYVRGRAHFETIAMIVCVLLLLAIAPQKSLAAMLVIYALSAPVTWAYQRLRTGNTQVVDSATDEEDAETG